MPIFLNKKDLAAWIELSQETVSDYLARGVLKKPENGKYDLQDCVRRIVHYQAMKLAGRAPTGELHAEKVILAREQAAAIRLRNEAARGETVLIVVVKQAIGEIYAGIRELFLGFPGRYAVALEMREREEVHEILTEGVAELLDELVDPFEERDSAGPRADRRTGRAPHLEGAAETHADRLG